MSGQYKAGIMQQETDAAYGFGPSRLLRDDESTNAFQLSLIRREAILSIIETILQLCRKQQG
jgi:hypothetical protein